MTDKKPTSEAKIAPATSFNPSGAPDQAPGIDLKHPSVDANPRAGTTVEQNKIDFNEPSGLASQEEMVAANLKAQD